MIEHTNSPLRILIADDDTDDQLIAKEIIAQDFSSAEVSSVYTGQQLINYINRSAEYHDLKTGHPHIVLLDINMPVCNGLEALEKLKKEVALKKTIFIVLSTGHSDTDIEKAMSLGATAYFSKPSTMDQYRQVIAEIIHKNSPHGVLVF